MFDMKKAEDFKENIILYLKKMLRAQEEIGEHWAHYLPDIQQMQKAQQQQVEQTVQQWRRRGNMFCIKYQV